MYRILLLLFLFLASCGFHLKGGIDSSIKLPFKIWNIENASDDIEKYLKMELDKYPEVRFVDNNEEAVIKIIDMKTNKQLQTINRIGVVDDYLLSLEILAQVFYKGKIYGDPIDFRINRFITINNNIVGKQEEEALIWKNIYKEAAQNIINRIRFIKNTDK